MEGLGEEAVAVWTLRIGKVPHLLFSKGGKGRKGIRKGRSSGTLPRVGTKIPKHARKRKKKGQKKFDWVSVQASVSWGWGGKRGSFISARGLKNRCERGGCSSKGRGERMRVEKKN